MIDIFFASLTDMERNRILNLWQEHGAALVLYARRKLGSDSGEAEDIVHDAFEKLMIRYEQYGGLGDEQMKGLLFRIVTNRCTDRQRSLRFAAQIPPEEEGWEENLADPAGRSPEDFVVSEDNIRRMKSVIRSLPPVLREPLEMKIFEDLTTGEIAGELGITEEAVRQRLSRGRAQVRILWEEEEHGSHR